MKDVHLIESVQSTEYGEPSRAFDKQRVVGMTNLCLFNLFNVADRSDGDPVGGELLISWIT